MLTATTEVFAHGPHYGWGGPGPFFFIFPLLWFLLFATVIFLIVRRARRGPRGGWGGPWAAHAAAGADPVTLLGNRFARGEIDEAEYRSRLSVLRSADPYPGAGPASNPSAGPTAAEAPPAAPTPQDQPPADGDR
ncbi:SHOCT domain-containing protein [Promicromonospora sp. NPDC057138]|uniref:SHOCT domain-containing protein n=1 Tax=Promicromonospora sp. NPDC057138 TaxID=3346031 RepID=UPI00362E315F